MTELRLTDGGIETVLLLQRPAARELPALEVLGGCCGTDSRHVTAICDACPAD